MVLFHTMSHADADKPMCLKKPLYALLYYFCVQKAIQCGSLQVPSSHKLAKWLHLEKTIGPNGKEQITAENQERMSGKSLKFEI